MKVSRFLLTATACGGLLAGILHFAQPTSWFTSPSATAVVEVRVVPRFAPTAASVRQTILSESFLNSAWNRFRNIGTSVAEPTDAEAPEVAVERQAHLTQWRTQLDVEIEPHFVDDQRQIRISCAAGDDIVSAGELVQFLATRYAGELAAARWYDAVDRLRVSQQQYKTSGDELLAIVHQAVAANKSAVLRMPSADSDAIRTVASSDDEAGAPRLIAPNNDAGPTFDAPIQIAAPPAAKKVPFVSDVIVERKKDVGVDTARLGLAERQFLTAGGSMERELSAMLTPQSAEFPVVATAIEGRHFGHVQGFWYAVAALAGLTVAAIVEWLRARNAGIQVMNEAALVNPLSRYVEPAAATATVELPAAPSFIRTPEDAVRAVRAPLIGVVRRPSG